MFWPSILQDWTKWLGYSESARNTALVHSLYPNLKKQVVLIRWIRWPFSERNRVPLLFERERRVLWYTSLSYLKIYFIIGFQFTNLNFLRARFVFSWSSEPVDIHLWIRPRTDRVSVQKLNCYRISACGQVQKTWNRLNTLQKRRPSRRMASYWFCVLASDKTKNSEKLKIM